MDPAIISAIIGGITTAAATGTTFGVNARLNKKNRKWQEKMYMLNQTMNDITRNYQNEYNQRMALDEWNRNNEYNSPQAQMQRYMDAGLNPNLIYSQANGGDTSLQFQPASDSSGSAPSSNPYVNTTDFNALANAGMQLANTIANQRTVEINNNAKRAETMFYYGVDPGSGKMFTLDTPTFGGNKRETFNLSASALKHQIDKDNRTLALSEKQFEQTIREFGERIRQFNTEINFKEKQLRESGRQFDKRLQHDINVLENQKQSAYEQLQIAKENLKLNKETQYFNTYQLRLYENFRTGKGGFFNSLGDLGHYIGMGLFSNGIPLKLK